MSKNREDNRVGLFIDLPVSVRRFIRHWFDRDGATWHGRH
jgi:hypothetical protein